MTEEENTHQIPEGTTSINITTSQATHDHLNWVEKYSAILYAVLLVLGVLAMMLMVGAAYHFSQENKQRIIDIQEEREFAARTSCEDVNDRHRDTIALLNARIDAAIKADPTRRQQLNESREYTRLLITALVPLRDCDAYVRKLIIVERDGRG